MTPRQPRWPSVLPAMLAALVLAACASQFALAPNGDLFTGRREGVIRRIAPDGTVSVVAESFQSIRGVAFDAGRRQLYAIEHGKGMSTLRRVPVD
ncbi:hypothetical protein SAMN05216345_104398 [Cupriavidus sp. YR651]|uniref:hypothetical protein n=1 Tax=Cupriavidus sp. YR651 TaxID=1855315 RepID=UPI00088F794A|nr:hypothetical protein [Cupriavidus sp. YR651]SDC90639.1 hypothetical protein SAMN05216345_104398 [Cupriavidus sp. YR651]